ncbi:CSEP0190 putative effector protein [Blumeria hordei DH14]|uniref:CSEP0190 putative effector protein n=1 Tax=Blumeria graminis f. sp. hordei (strain DH14) TaxID=546991 RepID=N1JGE1_BLUG1|nr:CSEP0190 putative effector protein [Blumeria hordei DH14]
MRSFIVVLILQSISFSMAALKSYLASHIPEQQKAFNCDGRVYDSFYLQQHRADNGRFYSTEALDYGILKRLHGIARKQGTGQKLMYSGDFSTPCNGLVRIYSHYTRRPFNPSGILHLD